MYFQQAFQNVLNGTQTELRWMDCGINAILVSEARNFPFLGPRQVQEKAASFNYLSTPIRNI